jgi:hypothetical protein
MEKPHPEEPAIAGVSTDAARRSSGIADRFYELSGEIAL